MREKGSQTNYLRQRRKTNLSLQFSESKVEYASHQLSLYYGECPHKCAYCFVKNYRKRKWAWACGNIRDNPKAFDLAAFANNSNIKCLVVSFTSDPLPITDDSEEANFRLYRLQELMNILEERKIPTKVLTKNAQISEITKEVNPYKYISIGLSVTTNLENEYMRELWEKNTSTIKERLFALSLLRMEGFKTWASVEPILPKTKPKKLVFNLIRLGLDEIWVGKSNYVSNLVNAHNWRKMALDIQSLNSKRVFLKKELREYLTQSGNLEEYLS